MILKFFFLDGKTGKVITSSQASDIKVKYQPYQTMHVKMFGKLPIIYKQEYTYGTKKFSVNDEQSFIFGVASPNKVILSADGKTGNKNFKNAQKFWNGKVALKNSIYYNKSQKNRALWIKYEQKVGG